jgi:hypothetical protein
LGKHTSRVRRKRYVGRVDGIGVEAGISELAPADAVDAILLYLEFIAYGW